MRVVCVKSAEKNIVVGVRQEMNGNFFNPLTPISNMKCKVCKKRRITEQHYDEILTPDGQEIQEYDFAQLCVECSLSQYAWKLHGQYEIKDRRFIRREVLYQV